MTAALVALLLIAESLLTVIWCARLVPELVVYPWTVAVLAGVRALVAALQFAAGMMVLRDHPAGRGFARVAFAASAVLLAVELGGNLTPSNVFPSYRWPLVAGYGVYALCAIWLAGRTGPSHSGTP